MPETLTTSNPTTLISLFSSLCYLFIFAQVYGQSRHSRIRKAFLLFSFSYFLLTLLEFLLRQPYTINALELISRITLATFMSTGFLLLNLMYALVSKKMDKHFYFLSSLCLLGVASSLLPNMVKLVIDENRGYYVILPSLKLSVLMLFSTIYPAFYSLYIGISHYKTTTVEREKRVLKLMLTGLSISIFFGILFLYILPNLFKGSLIFYEFSSLTTLFLLFFIYQAVNKYYFMIINYDELEHVSRSLFANIGDGVIVIGKLNEVVEFNSVAKKLFGDVITLSIIKKCIPDYNPSKLYDNVLTKIHVNDHEITVKINQSDVGNDDILFGKLLVVTDVSRENELLEEQLRLEDKVRQSEKMQAIGQLAGGVAHDFNNQLAGIMGCADLINEEVQDNEYLSELSENILNSAKRAGGLTQQLLAFARKGKYLSKPINVHDLIKEVTTLLSRSIDKKIEIKNIYEAKNCIVIGDPSQLNNTFLNLAINARDAMLENGTITFKTSNCYIDEYKLPKVEGDFSIGDYLKIEITDDGIGIPPHILSKIFDPFFTTKEMGKGTGMGLAAVYGTINNHRGFIDVVSEEGRGTSFYIYLPLSKDEMKIKDTKTVPVIKNQQKDGRILLIDDERIINLTTKKTLEKLGYEVNSYFDSNEALKHFKENSNSYDIIILDLIMPVIDGYKMFDLLREIKPDAKILIASGYSLDKKTQTLIDNGAVGFMQKPFRKMELENRIINILNGETE